MRPMLKICGLMREEDVRMCCEMGVDICGFVTEYPLDVPWNLTREQCAALIPQVVPPTKSCIVTGGASGAVIALALALRPDYVQLHYHETIEDTADIVRVLSPGGIRVIKTISASPEERRSQFKTDDPALCAKLLTDIGVSVILVDSRGPSNASSGGSAADLPLYEKVKKAAGCPVMLGGGIRPDNYSHIAAVYQPDILDVMTGVETVPGVKSRELLRLMCGETA